MKKSVNATLASFAVITALALPALATPTQAPVDAPVAPQAPIADDRQPPQPALPAAPAESQSAKGTLVKVDTDAMTIVIKGDDQQEQQFRYTDATQVVGAQEQVSGLSTKAGARVTIHYIAGAEDNRVATKVEFDEAPK